VGGLGQVAKAGSIETERPLENEIHERFVWVYVFGSEALELEIEPPVLPGNRSAAYRCVRPEVSESGVRSQASKLLRRPEVLDRIVTLKQERDRQIRARAPGFVPFFEDAVKTIDQIRRGAWRPESMSDIDPRTIPQMAQVAFKAATEIVGRVQGGVTQMHDVTRTQEAIVVHVLAAGSADQLSGDETPSARPVREPIEVLSVTDT